MGYELIAKQVDGKNLGNFQLQNTVNLLVISTKFTELSYREMFKTS